ncbi:hypothetical protein KSP40_PGU020433 [Platanthera guangdongensis]|uniref:Single-stranded DNA binding protein Ssb-like OB fold domain-containing protein n=1 Tax=Platanthera guangdongensis TaxID=2320717 RepID=A0ABR2MW33_9ASPA
MQQAPSHVNHLHKSGTTGHTLVVKVVSSNTVLQKGRAASAHFRQTKIAECLVEDETGAIIFTARNEQGSISPLPSSLFSIWFIRYCFCWISE